MYGMHPKTEPRHLTVYFPCEITKKQNIIEQYYEKLFNVISKIINIFVNTDL